MPSKDSRPEYDNAAKDIRQHAIRNPSDWPDDWVFRDSRFNLLRGPDDNFLKFLCEMVHPIVMADADEATRLVAFFNEHLAKDGWEIAETMRVSDKPVYAARPLLEGAGLSVAAAKEVAEVFDAAYVSRQITRMEAAIQNDPELAIGTAKEFIETICKTILTERGVPFAENEKLPKLVKSTIGTLTVVPPDIQNAAAAEENIRILVNNLGAIGHHMAKLRNDFGTGHGKDAQHGGLVQRHARLAVNAASTLGVFLFECHRDTATS